MQKRIGCQDKCEASAARISRQRLVSDSWCEYVDDAGLRGRIIGRSTRARGAMVMKNNGEICGGFLSIFCWAKSADLGGAAKYMILYLAIS